MAGSMNGSVHQGAHLARGGGGSNDVGEAELLVRGDDGRGDLLGKQAGAGLGGQDLGDTGGSAELGDGLQPKSHPAAAINRRVCASAEGSAGGSATKRLRSDEVEEERNDKTVSQQRTALSSPQTSTVTSPSSVPAWMAERVAGVTVPSWVSARTRVEPNRCWACKSAIVMVRKGAEEGCRGGRAISEPVPARRRVGAVPSLKTAVRGWGGKVGRFGSSRVLSE